MFDLLESKANFSNFLLKINCRNTRQVGEETSMISGFPKPPFLLEYLEGVPVEYLFYHDEEHQLKIIQTQLDKLLSMGLRYSDFVILSRKKLENTRFQYIKKYKIKEIIYTDSIYSNEWFIRFSTIHAFKGLESDYIMITDIEDMTSEISKSLAYVAMSRARFGLIILVSEKLREHYKNILRTKLNEY